MQLAKNFTLEECLHSQDAISRNIDNSTDDPKIIENIKNVVMHILQPVRDKFGPYSPSSVYRCPKLNAAIGGVATSQHCFGEAADFKIWGIANYEVAKWIADNLTFDQLILEFPVKDKINAGWIHASWSNARLRHEVLTSYKEPIGNGKFKTKYLSGFVL